jgi:sulfhydrogenase subunit delta
LSPTAPTPELAPTKKTLAVFKMASCDGCQLMLLNCEDELLAVAEHLEICNFLEASSRVLPGPYDLVLVEGSVTTREDAERILAIRKSAKFLVTIGACATAGGIQALRNFASEPHYKRLIYADPLFVETLATSTPIAAHVPVDFELRGCPIDKRQLLEVITAFLVGRKPQIPNESVCTACKRKGNVCVLVADGTPCLGPVTHAGCDALCPTYARGCFGCFGPKENPNTHALALHLQGTGVRDDELVRLFRSFTGAAEPFADESRRHEAPTATPNEGEP